MLEQLATRFRSAGLMAGMVTPEQRIALKRNVVLTVARVLEPESMPTLANGSLVLNSFHFEVEEWNQGQLLPYLGEQHALGDCDSKLFLADRTEILVDRERFVFQNNPVGMVGGNPWFLRYEFDSQESAAQFLWNYYFGSPLDLSVEWTIPIQCFPNWNASRLNELFGSCRTIGGKSCSAIEGDSESSYRSFESCKSNDRSLKIRSDGGDLFILDESIDEWLEWSKQNRLKFH